MRQTFRFLLLPSALCVLLSSCVAWTPFSKRASQEATVIANVPLQRWDILTCGAGSLSAVLQRWGDPMTMDQWQAALPKTRGGVMTIDMVIAARQRGFDARIVTGTPEIVNDELREGRPVILMTKVIEAPGAGYDFFHYIVLDGVDPKSDLVRVQYGDGKARWVRMGRLTRTWRGGGFAAILIKPNDVAPALAGGSGESLRAGVTLEEAGKFAEAATHYRALLQKQPDSAVVWTNLGNAEMQLQRRPEAEEAFRRALALDPQSRDAMNNLAWLLLEEKRLDEAEALARKASAQPGPDSYLVLDTLARVLAARGACGEALSTFEQALAAVPPSRATSKADIDAEMQKTRATCKELSS